MQRISPDRVFSQEDSAAIRAKILPMLLDSIKHVKETDLGYQLRLGSDAEDLVLVADWVQLERLCNPFLRFNLQIESKGGPISLDICGPSGTKSFLSREMSLSRWL